MENPMLLELWIDFPHDMMGLIHHIIRAIRILAVRRHGHAEDTQSSPSTTPMYDEKGGDPLSSTPLPRDGHVIDT